MPKVDEIKSEYRPKLKPLLWKGDRLLILDQTRLPFEETFIEAKTVEDVAEAIRGMKVRGAPAIGIAAAYGMVLALKRAPADRVEDAMKWLRRAQEILSTTRPTAVNLFWALDRIRRVCEKAVDGKEVRKVGELVELAEAEANRMFEEELEAEISIGLNALSLLEKGDTVLTQCNAGGLATGTGLGTALAPVKLAKFLGMEVGVIVPETRPWLQGARLTVYELMVEGVRTTLIADTAVGLVMYRGMVDSVMVGADRILLDGHVYNKIGTLKEAVLAHEFNIPFYVLAPTSSVDPERTTAEVEIEERDPDEVRRVISAEGRVLITRPDVPVYNPVFDVTPPKYITAIITEKGIAYKPFDRSLRRMIGALPSWGQS